MSDFRPGKTRAAKCLTDDIAAAFVEGKLTDEALAIVEIHLDDCPSCRQQISLTAKVRHSNISAMRQVTAELVPRVVAEGTTIDRYIVLRTLGVGGMGVVYAAYDPELKRTIALKLVRPDVADGSQIRRTRLLREAQTMARLQHPNVIAIYDIGSIGDQVYIAMELVDGLTLTDWVHEAPRSWRQLLSTFAQAGQGLAAAHAAGVTHRDFKPDNVLIDKAGRVHVTDFGLARAADDAGSPTISDQVHVSSPNITHTGSTLGTPAYMSPEQHAGRSADARSDQFSFCVALYEGLYGEHPFAGASSAELVERVLSGRVGSAPAKTKVPAYVRRALLRGLALAPENRYASITALVSDLTHDPWVKRRRALAVTGFVALSALVIFSYQHQRMVCKNAERKLIGVWDGSRKQKIHDAFVATQLPYAAETWTTVEHALDDYTNDWVAMRTEACKATRMRGEQSEALLDLRMQCLDQRMNETRALTDLFTHADAQVTEKAVAAVSAVSTIDACADAHALMQSVRPPEDRATSMKVNGLRVRLAAVKALEGAAKYKAAIDAAKQIVEEARALNYHPIASEALFEFGKLQEISDDNVEAEKTLNDSIWHAEASRHDDVIAAASPLLILVLGPGLGRFDDAEQIVARASAALERTGHPPRFEIAFLRATAFLKNEKGDYEEALNRFDKALALTEKNASTDTISVSKLLSDSSTSLVALGRFEEARSRLARALALQEKLLGSNHPDVIMTLDDLGNLTSEQGDQDRALAYFDRARRAAERTFGTEHRLIGEILGGIGLCYERKGDFNSALDYLRRALLISERVGSNSSETDELRGYVALALHELGRDKEAKPMQERLLKNAEATFGPNHPSVANALENLGILLQDTGENKQALAYHRRALSIFQRAAPADKNIAMALGNMSIAERHLVNYQAALGDATHAVEFSERAIGKDNPELVGHLLAVGEALLGLHAFDRAVAPLERAVAIAEAVKDNKEELAAAQFALARALCLAGRDPHRVAALATQARSTYLTHTTRNRKELAEVDQWLATRHTN